MSDPRRRHFSRIVLWQECVGNVLDLSPRWCLATSGPDVQEDTSDTIIGTERPDRRTHAIEVPLSDEETARLAEIMEELSNLYGHRIGATLLGSKGAQHIQWAEATSLRVLPEGRGFFGMAASSLRLKTSIFHASIQETNNLIESVPWEGTSTVGSAAQVDGFTTLEDGEVAVYDDSQSEVFLHEVWDGDTYKRLSVDNLGGRTGLTAYVRSGSEELIVVDRAKDSIKRYDFDGTLLGTIEPRGTGGADYEPQGVTVAAGDLAIISAADDVYLYSGVPTDGQVNAASTFALSSETGEHLAYDAFSGDLLSVRSVSATTTDELRRHDGISSTVTDTTGIGAKIATDGGRLYLADTNDIVDRGPLGDSGLPTGNVGSVDGTRRMPLRVRNANGRPERGYYGPTWRAGHEVSVGIQGIPDVVSDTEPILLDFTLPIGTAELILQNVEGSLDGLDFGGTAIGISDSSRIGSPPQLLLEGGKYSGLGINATAVWAVRCRLEDVAARPELVVAYSGAGTGDTRGALRGGYSETCVQLPEWGAAVEAIAFDWDADAGDELSITVVDAAGNYVGQISGEGEAVKGTSATFTAENAGVYTAELVAQPDFSGVTDVDLGGRIDLSTLDLANLVDLDVLDLFSFGGGGSAWKPFGTASADIIPPNATVLEASQIAGDIPLGIIPDRFTRLFFRGSSNMSGQWSNRPDSLEDANWANTSISGTITKASIPSNLFRLIIDDSGLQTDGTNGLATAEGLRDVGIEYLSVDGVGQELRFDVVLEASTVVELNNRGQEAYGDLSGTDPDGDPYLKSSLVILNAFPDSQLTGAPNDWQDADSLEQINIRKRYQRSGIAAVPWDAGKGYDNAIDGLYADLLNDGTLFSGPKRCRFEETVSRDLTGDGNRMTHAVTTLSQSSVSKIAGLHSYHPNNGGQGIVDFGLSVFSESFFTLAFSSRVDSATIEVEDPKFLVFSSGDQKIYEKNGKLTIKTSQDDGNGNPTQVFVEMIQPGDHVRLFDPNGSTDLLLEVDSSSYDSSAGIITINIKTSADEGEDTSIPTGVDGNLYGGQIWTPDPAATP